MSAAIKPEIYASWIPNGNVGLSPQIFISYIPNGEIKATPQFYASVVFVPHVEKATADTSRNLSKLENVPADTFRKTGNIENSRADLKRKVTANEKSNSALNRRIGISEKIQSRTFRKLTFSDKATGKLFRHVKKIERISADTSRKTGLTTFATDLFRVVKSTEKIPTDILRRVANTEKFSADSLRKITSIENIYADSLRRAVETSETNADTLRKVVKLENATVDTFRKVAVSEKTSTDTFLQIKKTEKATADTLRGLREKSTADTFRKVVRPEKTVADTVIRVPHILNFCVQNPILNSLRKNILRNSPAQSLINSLKDYDVTAFNVTLSERTLSDSFTVETAQEFYINDAVKGQFLDYPFSFLVEETDEQDLNFSVKGMYDIDKLLYSFIETDLHDETEIYLDGVRYYGASSYVSKIAGYLGLTANIKIEDFTPYNVVGNTNITYSDLISSLFTWTARLPQRQINVFIRGGTLHCIQRGLEDSVFDISDIPHSRPKVNKKLLRSMYNSPFDDNEIEETKNIPFSGTIRYSDSYSRIETTYSRGLLMKEFLRTINGETDSVNITTYEYFGSGSGDNRVYYLSKKHIDSTITQYSQYGNTVTQSKTENIFDTVYKYRNAEDGFYIYEEREESVKKESGDGFHIDDEEKNIRQTLHTPVGNGWYSTTVYENGEHQGSTISQGKPSNEVSLYTIQQVRRSFGSSAENNDYEAQRSRLAAIADISFPVRELDLIEALTDDLKWLNRKIQITVNVDLISRVENGVPDLKHIVDFTERVKLDGVEYFLVSNNVSLTPRKFIQKLQLVRWSE